MVPRSIRAAPPPRLSVRVSGGHRATSCRVRLESLDGVGDAEPSQGRGARRPAQEVLMAGTVSTDLYIGGRARHTAGAVTITDPARPGVVVGHAAAATKEDVADAVAAAKAAFPAWAALPASERAARMADAISGIADDRDEDARVLSLENGKIRMEAWVDALVFEIRWQLALSLADEVDSAKVLPPA